MEQKPDVTRWAFGAGLGAIALSILIVGLSRPASMATSDRINAPAASPAALPAQSTFTEGVVVTCGPGEQAQVRQLAMNGTMVPQVQCLPAVVPGMVTAPGMVAAPGAWPTATAVPAALTTDMVSMPQPAPQVRRQVVYRDAPRERRVSSGRSWQKSAIIIGSSAGIAAGVGGAVGGKKGALIGAALGGGGAAIWDQATRRQ